MKRLVRIAAWAGTVVLALTLRLSAQNAEWITPAQQERILQEIRAGLPAGWIINQSVMNRTPVDWHTLDARALQIDGSQGAQTFQTWVLPKDWIGIRQVRPGRQRVVYWEGILMGPDFKTITNTDQAEVHEALQKLLGYTPSLTNGGASPAAEVFKDRIGEVDKQAQALVDRYCKDQACRDEAAYSLIVLGVPSKTVILDCAERGQGKAQDFCASALGYLKGPDSIRVLERLLTAASTTPEARKYAAGSLESIADLSSAPALLEALRMNVPPETSFRVVQALERLRYAPAAPDILYRMETEPPDAFQQSYYAKALATLRYKPAIPAIQALSGVTKVTADWIVKERQKGYLDSRSPAISLLRLTGEWGISSEGIRVLIFPPEKNSETSVDRAVVVLENTGEKARGMLMGDPPSSLIVDGRKYALGPILLDGNPNLEPNDVYVTFLDLAEWLPDDAEHRLEYAMGSAVSNTIIVQRQHRP